MYGRFRNTELFCGLPHSRIVLNDIISDLDRPFLYIALHSVMRPRLGWNAFPPTIVVVTLYAEEMGCSTEKSFAVIMFYKISSPYSGTYSASRRFPFVILLFRILRALCILRIIIADNMMYNVQAV